MGKKQEKIKKKHRFLLLLALLAFALLVFLLFFFVAFSSAFFSLPALLFPA
jgi:hypothetical protein